MTKTERNEYRLNWNHLRLDASTLDLALNADAPLATLDARETALRLVDELTYLARKLRETHALHGTDAELLSK